MHFFLKKKSSCAVLFLSRSLKFQEFTFHLSPSLCRSLRSSSSSSHSSRAVFQFPEPIYSCEMSITRAIHHEATCLPSPDFPWACYMAPSHAALTFEATNRTKNLRTMCPAPSIVANVSPCALRVIPACAPLTFHARKSSPANSTCPVHSSARVHTSFPT